MHALLPVYHPHTGVKINEKWTASKPAGYNFNPWYAGIMKWSSLYLDKSSALVMLNGVRHWGRQRCKRQFTHIWSGNSRSISSDSLVKPVPTTKANFLKQQLNLLMKIAKSAMR